MATGTQSQPWVRCCCCPPAAQHVGNGKTCTKGAWRSWGGQHCFSLFSVESRKTDTCLENLPSEVMCHFPLINTELFSYSCLNQVHDPGRLWPAIQLLMSTSRSQWPGETLPCHDAFHNTDSSSSVYYFLYLQSCPIEQSPWQPSHQCGSVSLAHYAWDRNHFEGL